MNDAKDVAFCQFNIQLFHGLVSVCGVASDGDFGSIRVSVWMGITGAEATLPIGKVKACFELFAGNCQIQSEFGGYVIRQKGNLVTPGCRLS